MSTAIDQFANKLWDEESNNAKLMATPHLWSEKKATHVAAVNRHLKSKRILLKDVTGSRTVTHHSSSSVITTTATTSVIDLDEDLTSPFDHIAPVSSPVPTTASPPKTTLPPSISPSTALPPSIPLSTLHPFFQHGGRPSVPSTTLPPRVDIPADKRCKCGQHKFNQSCPSKLCQKCCGNSMDHCTVTSHVKCKPVGYQSTKYKPTPTPATPLPDVQPGVVRHLDKAMQEGREVFIAYANRDLNEKQARKVKPLQWIRYGEAFKAFCFIDNIEKIFNTHKILRIEDQVWTTGMLILYCKVINLTQA
jgi:hypothetical protein